ncbi:cobalt-precorrin 5A hydrolase [Thermodesulforhabdus norvegica]|uniref:Cobalt-precorrin 5A acetaldehyde-lyase n=1 Tax=Thermodesulforhabdus norvegica TaxID=39841 RepID=A0A1I4W606_9BACT|nr:cobalt-precorrin 5A hydrolase [Thermodesulforhabdus norvegica]SFN09011.1 cobalt-precorrin 5A acetaldehyde-lyase [Thermodesulforhabdus norvegica]
MSKSGKASVAVLSLTRRGAKLALRISRLIDGATCFIPERLSGEVLVDETQGVSFFDDFREVFNKVWNSFEVIVCIMATGIVVRTVAPLLRSKMEDPAVIVVDEAGNYAISLLSGHVGGANRWTVEIADLIGATPVITTASDVSGKRSLDLTAIEKGLEIDRKELLPTLMVRLLDGERVWIFDPEDRIYPGLSADYPNLVKVDSLEGGGSSYGIWVCEEKPPEDAACVALYPRNLIVGIGCNRGTSAEEIIKAVTDVFDEHRLALSAILYFASVDLKSREPGLLDAVRFFGRDILFHGPELLERIRVPNPSEVVKRYVGVSSVCEASVLASNPRARLIVTKKKRGNVTVAIGKASSIW